ncbi:hypothetical protein FN846DRAFT_894242 [Sphaerosporella brunnea]|uniref:Uncharacterized protein n=1 Tax=Sphaerosporella brunnea TaxID=1250544 RepID=A0A5J5EIX8_9PEZI|nr:hypothetical protein FN846DRAFT_894242 [Sphaerosporella brunnea]
MVPCLLRIAYPHAITIMRASSYNPSNSPASRVCADPRRLAVALVCVGNRLFPYASFSRSPFPPSVLAAPSIPPVRLCLYRFPAASSTPKARYSPPPHWERLANIGFISSHDMGGGHERRSRIVDLEEMMLMEAIRQSLAEEEERKRKEEREREKGKGKEPVAHDNHRNGEASGSAQTGEDGSLDGFRNLAQIVVADKDAQTTEHVEDAEGSEGKGVAVSVGGVVGVEETR